MLSENEIKKELEKSEFLYRLKQKTREHCKQYWQAGYCQALRVVLQMEKSNIVKEIKEITDFEKLSKLIEEEKSKSEKG